MSSGYARGGVGCKQMYRVFLLVGCSKRAHATHHASPYHTQVLFFFLMGWVAALTILVQGSTTGLLLQVLGMTRTPTIKKTFLEHVLRQVEDEGEVHASKQQLDPLLGAPRWDVVRTEGGDGGGGR